MKPLPRVISVVTLDTTTINREELMRSLFKFKTAAIAAAAVGFAGFSTASLAEDTLRIVSWGGAYQKGQSVGIFQPAAKAMGITVKEILMAAFLTSS